MFCFCFFVCVFFFIWHQFRLQLPPEVETPGSWRDKFLGMYCSDVIMGAIVSQITGISIVYSIVWSGADQRKHQSSVSLVFVGWIHRWPVNSPHKGPATRKMFPFNDVSMAMIKLDCLERDLWMKQLWSWNLIWSRQSKEMNTVRPVHINVMGVCTTAYSG